MSPWDLSMLIWCKLQLTGLDIRFPALPFLKVLDDPPNYLPLFKKSGPKEAKSYPWKKDSTTRLLLTQSISVKVKAQDFH